MTTAVQSKTDLLTRLGRHKDELKRLGVRRLGLFGSFQREEPRPESDVEYVSLYEANELVDTIS